MKIFITGATGFIGKNLLEFYTAKGHNVFSFLRGMDITSTLVSFNPDVIINCAAEIYNADIMWEPNVLLVRDCLEYVKKNPSTKLIQIGSSSEYGSVPRATKETDRINPTDMYQATKGTATLLCQGYANNYKLDVTVARPYSVYGKYERPRRFFPKLWQAFKLGHKLTLYQGFHDFIYIDDFVRGIDILVQRTIGPTGDIVNFGSGIQYSNLEVLQLFEKITGQQANVTVIDKKMSERSASDIWICDTSYAREMYGFQTEFTLEQGITQFLATATY